MFASRMGFSVRRGRFYPFVLMGEVCHEKRLSVQHKPAANRFFVFGFGLRKYPAFLNRLSYGFGHDGGTGRSRYGLGCCEWSCREGSPVTIFPSIPYEEAYLLKAARLERQQYRRSLKTERERGIMDARKAYGYR